ncbi:hypothetical protein [Acetivibrio cellulolyticus]|uniref:hypothetical protein n=1 Tax=Acetivibrio cellulolyticus TaxID=35830 RepID=UPI0001E305C6|nr:hypothetical protein [Acetivibrio cellulolyticus]
MKDSNMQKRSAFVLSLLNELNDVYKELKKLSSGIESNSDNFYESIFNSSKVEIQGDIDSFKSNLEKMKEINMNITAKLNEWYDFIKDSSEIRKVTFPIKMYFMKKDLKNSITKMNAEISNLSIENRFIREKIINWEQELSVKALHEIRNGQEFNSYEDLVRKKDNLIIELKYLLATIPDLAPVEFDLDNIDRIIDKLLKIAAA